jgi:two-component system, chemotaxis family, sensor kinase CheA
VQYRGQLMPLVSLDGEMRVKSEGAQPLLVFSDSGRSMGLVVDEIIDIVEDRLDIEVSSDRPGILGSAVIKGHATEIIDVGHFLPLAFEDWFRRKERTGPSAARTVLLVDDSDFFRNLLAPVLKAAGFRVVAVPGAADALSLMKAGQRFDVVVTDIEMPDMNGFEFAEALRGNPRTAEIPIIALSAMVSADAIKRGREVGFHDFVAKFDRPGLVAAVKEQSADLNQAA